MKKSATVLSVLLLMSCLSTCTAAEETHSAADACLTEMVAAAARGDSTAGVLAEKERQRIIEKGGGTERLISYTELEALSRFIASQAGDNWLSEELRLCVGEVALNRVASPDFPDDIISVCLDFGVTEAQLAETLPSIACVNAALRLLQGQRLLSPEVLYISGEKQSRPYATFCSRLRGYTYFYTDK